MINQDRVREMNKMAILESGAGEKELKISTYRRADFVILQLVKGFVAGTVCFAAIVMLWLCSIWDDLNQYFANVDYMQLLKQTAIFYIIFMAGYLVLCALVAVYQHKKCRERRDQYLRYLHRLNKSYLAEEKAREDA